MDKKVHDIDDIDNIFNRIFLRFEDQPSGEVWNKLNAMLDKEDVDKFKKRFHGWKIAAFLLLLLLSGILLYDSRGVLERKIDAGLSSNKHIPDPGSSIVNQTLASGELLSKTQDTLKIKLGSTGKQNTKTRQLLKSLVLPEVAVNRSNNLINQKKSLAFLSATPNSQASENDDPVEIRSKTVENLRKFIVGKHKNGAILPVILEDSISEMGKLNKNKIQPFQPESLVYINSVLSEAIPLTVQSAPNTFQGNTSTLYPHENIKSSIVNSGNLSLGEFKSYWAVTGFASHEWSQYNLNNEGPDNNPGTQNQQEEISTRENHVSSFSLGLVALHQFTKRFGYKTGLVISNTSILIDPQEMYATREPGGVIGYKYITSSGYAYINPKFGSPPSLGDSLQSANAQHRLQSLAIPLQLVYRIDYRKFSVMPSAGISINFISRATVQTVVKDAFNRENISIQSLYGMRKVYLGFMADINFQYNYTKRWSFNVLPMLRYALTPITKNNVVKTYPYSVGISAGVTYHLFK